MIDLHMHSSYSDDGEFTPAQLAEQCAALGITMMAVTDHNCVKACEEAEEAAARLGIGWISGVEIDCVYKGVNFHVLGYGIDYRSQDFVEIEENVARQDARASLQMLEKTRALGFPVTEADMRALARGRYRESSWTGEMIGEWLLGNPALKEDPRLAPYRAGGPRGDNPYVNFYWDYYSQGKPCHVAVIYPPMEEMIDTIHRNGGRAVLAHPGANLKRTPEENEALLGKMISLGMDGIEAFSSYHTREQAEYYSRKAAQYGCAVTCGSDYHGKTKPAISLGKAVFGGGTDPEEEMKKITDWLQSR